MTFRGFDRSGRAALTMVVIAVLGLAAAAVIFWSTRDRSQTTHAAAVDPQDQLAREAAARSDFLDDFGVALAALKPLAERTNASLEDLIAAAACEANLGVAKDARKYLERALAIDRDAPAAHFILARLAKDDGDLATTEKEARLALARAPDDLPARLMLASSIESTKPKEAEAIWRSIQALGVDRAGNWYLPALYRLSTMLRTDNREAEASAFGKEFQELVARGVQAPKDPELDRGNLGRIRAPSNWPGPGATLAAMPKFQAATPILPELAAMHLLAVDADDDCHVDVLGFGAKGLALALAPAKNGGAWRVQHLADGPIQIARTLDLINRDVLDVVYADANGALRAILATRRAKPDDAQVDWKATEIEFPKFATESAKTVRELVPVDYDEDGDLDLLVLGDFGVRLLRNDGAGRPGGTFTDVTTEAGLPRDRRFEWCVIEDFDTDQDIDLLLGGSQGVFLASNLRGGKFEDKTSVLGAFKPIAKPAIADFDHDGRPDLFDAAHPGDLWLGQPSGNFKRVDSELAQAKLDPAGRSEWLDLDLDGFFDVLTKSGGDGKTPLALEVARDLGWKSTSTRVEKLDLGSNAFDCVVDDFDGDLRPDLLVSTSDGCALLRGDGPFGNAVRLAFRGKKDNRRSVGAVVELRAGTTYQRMLWNGEAKLVGAGRAEKLEWRRVLWPNGILQWARSVALGNEACFTGDLVNFEQVERLGGSCPFLYTFDGAKNVFVSDVLGITPLGLPMAPGEFVPPDHDEFVLVHGDQLAAKDGKYEINLTEELREVTYLDRVQLQIVDHPSGTEIFPNELFTFPPFPEEHTHTLRDPLSPLRAIGSDGKDWTKALAANDSDFAAPFEPVAQQFLGLASPHFLELEFDKSRTENAKKLRLFLHGWFFWTDASINMASARDPETKFIPPILQVPDGKGGWKDAGPPIGFPAGKTKTMVVDVTQMIDKHDPRMRLFSSLRLYWDSIRLAVDDDDAPITVTKLEPASAKLWRRGFSAPLDDDKPNQPERFEWEHLADLARWNPHPGLYTKYGECLPLVTKVDDMFVILASGDALTVDFDATKIAPPAAGMVRDYLVYLDGWAKDRDPNTVDALFVEPLPFHAMSGYPYAASEHFPDDDAHRKWRREWNTRSPENWVDALGADTRQLTPSKAAIAPRN